MQAITKWASSWQTMLLKHCEKVLIVMSLFYWALKLLDNISYQSYFNEMIGHGFFDMVKAVFCAKDRDYNTSVLIWWVHGCTVGGGWTHRVRRHLLHERCRVYRGGGGRWRGPDQRREAVLDKHTGSHPPAMEQNVVICIWWKICLDIEVHCVNIYCLSTRLVCILCRYLVSNVQLVCKLSTDHALLFGITKVLPYWWDIYWYWSCATAAHSRTMANL